MSKVTALSTKFPETLNTERADRFWPTVKQFSKIPAIGTSEGAAPELIQIHLKYEEPGAAYYVAELDPETGRAYGYIDTGDPEADQWETFSLVDLERRRVPAAGTNGPGVVNRVTTWAPIFAYEAIAAMSAEDENPALVAEQPAPQAPASQPEAAPAQPQPEAPRYRAGTWTRATFALAQHVTKEQIYAAMRALPWAPMEQAAEQTRDLLTEGTRAWPKFGPIGRAATHPIADGFTLYAVEDQADRRRAYFVGSAKRFALILTAERAAA